MRENALCKLDVTQKGWYNLSQFPDPWIKVNGYIGRVSHRGDHGFKFHDSDDGYLNGSVDFSILESELIEIIPGVGDCVIDPSGKMCYITNVSKALDDLMVEYVDKNDMHEFSLWYGDELKWVSRPPKVGDKVVIQISSRNWASEMDCYDGQIYTIKNVKVVTENQTHVEFVGNSIINEWKWVWQHGHFTIVDHDPTFRIHIPKMPKPTKASVDLQFSESFREFLRDIKDDCRVARLLLNAEKLSNASKGAVLDKLITTKEVNYITHRKNGMLSYMPAGREQKLNENGRWSLDGRQEGRPGKVMRRLFTKNALKVLKDTDFEVFSNKYRAKYSTDHITLKVYDSDMVGEIYDRSVEHDDGNPLASSCMRGDGNYMGIYECNPNVSILVAETANGKVAGRALLWHKVSANVGTINFMDRVYVARDNYYDLFIDWAETNGYWYKVNYKSYDTKTLLFEPGTKEHKKVYMSVNCDTDHDEYPYIDTFSYGGDGYLQNHDEDCMFTYNCTGGSRENAGTWDDIRDCWIDDDDAVYIENGSPQYRHRTTHRDYCVRINSTWYHSEDEEFVVACELTNEYILRDDAVYSEHDGCFYGADHCTYVDHMEDYVLTDQCYEVDGTYYHESVVTKL
jgi:hypothetical protein